jgi:hypothetical protein
MPPALDAARLEGRATGVIAETTGKTGGGGVGTLRASKFLTMKRAPRGTLDRGRLLMWTTALTAIWVGCVVLRRGYASTGLPFAWRPSLGCVMNPPQYQYLLLDVAIWFALFYTGVRGFTLMQRSPFRRPFRWRPLPPDREQE